MESLNPLPFSLKFPSILPLALGEIFTSDPPPKLRKSRGKIGHRQTCPIQVQAWRVRILDSKWAHSGARELISREECPSFGKLQQKSSSFFDLQDPQGPKPKTQIRRASHFPLHICNRVPEEEEEKEGSNSLQTVLPLSTRPDLITLIVPVPTSMLSFFSSYFSF